MRDAGPERDSEISKGGRSPHSKGTLPEVSDYHAKGHTVSTQD